MASCDTIHALAGGLIVSIQTSADNPLHGDPHVACLARAAALGGAVAIRADTPAHVRIAVEAVDIPVIGIHTRSLQGSEVRITPTFDSARALVAAGAKVVSLDGTSRPRPGGGTLATLIAQIHDDLGVPVMADVPSVAEGIAARRAGADLVGSSVEGYHEGPGVGAPDVELVRRLVHALDCPVIAQRHYWTADEMSAAIDAGAHAVVVGSAISNPAAITRRFATAITKAAASLPPCRRTIRPHSHTSEG